MLGKLADLKVNFLVTFAGAAIIILLIKATPLLLPAKYYFNFSKLIAGASEPFIVDPPGVTGSRLCEVMKKYSIPDDAFRGHVDCASDYEQSALFSPKEVDEIYRIAFKSDDTIRKAISDAENQVKIKPLSDDQVREITSNQSDPVNAFVAIVNSYTQTISGPLDQSLPDMIDALYKDLIPQNTGDSDTSGSDTSALNVNDTNRLLEANRKYGRELNPKSYASSIQPIGHTDIDDILKGLNSKDSLPSAIAGYYLGELRGALRDDMDTKFASAGVTTNFAAVRQKVFDEINEFSWQNYTISILIRLTPVLLFGLVAGAMIGRGELFSVALAGGLAAFLLSWPLILMWDRLVQSDWADKKPIFFGFYALYVLSFFFTARAAGVLGAWIREQNIIAMPEGGTIRVKWADVAANLLIAVLFNGVVYAWNVYLPITAGLTR